MGALANGTRRGQSGAGFDQVLGGSRSAGAQYVGGGAAIDGTESSRCRACFDPRAERCRADGALTAADALGHIGPAAKSAVAALGARLRVEGEVIYVLRSDATALGDIGPDAASALPALREVLKITRVTAAAEEAILKINRQPVPTWY